MPQLNLTGNEKELKVRCITRKDLDDVATLSLNNFGPDMSLQKEHFESQFKLFPEGQICIEYNGEIVGTALSLIINIEDYGDNHNYFEVSDFGFIRNHNPQGKNLYGIEVCVNKNFRGMQLGRRLYEGRRKICKKFNLDSILIGGRMPNYYKFANQMSADQYALEVMKGNIHDPVLTFQMRNGFKLNKVISNYLTGDVESLEHGALMEWKNTECTPR